MPEREYVLLPKTGLRAAAGPALEAMVALPSTMSTQPSLETSLPTVGGVRLRVIDAFAEDSPKHVSLDDAAEAAINAPGSPLRAVPIVVYDRPDPRPQVFPAVAPAAGTAVTTKCEERGTGRGIQGADVIAFTSFALRTGARGLTDANGEVTLTLGGPVIDRLYVFAPTGFWGAFRSSVAIAPAIDIPIDAVDLTVPDCVRHFYPNTAYNPATGVVVGVVDTGVGPHPNLNVVGGANTVTGEPAGDFSDGAQHGTHVAGLIGSSGQPPGGLRGLAPRVPLWAYRVFPPGGGATNYAILKAMIFAASRSCDIINLSLGGGPYDPIVEEAIEDARQQGTMVVVAAGNDGRKAVSYPAAHVGATAVSAMGVEGTFPAGSLPEADVSRPPHSTRNPAEFVAAFSNIGPQIGLVGPGVGALSTLPGGAHGPMSGTSMAAPVVAGAAASLLSQNPGIFGMPRNLARAVAIERLLQTNAVRRHFGTIYEGFGLPDPAAI